jgi:hypothetical protein
MYYNTRVTHIKQGEKKTDKIDKRMDKKKKKLKSNTNIKTNNGRERKRNSIVHHKG